LRERVARLTPTVGDRREPLQLRERVGIGDVFRDGGLDDALGARGIAHLLFEHAREIEPRARLVARAVRAGDATLEELREILAPSERAVGEFERLERFVEQRVLT
jgi:hypothetical protein